MALIDCSECGHKVSEKATTCPQCGNPVLAAAKGSEDVEGGGGSLLGRLVGIAVLGYLFFTVVWPYLEGKLNLGAASHSSSYISYCERYVNVNFAGLGEVAPEFCNCTSEKLTEDQMQTLSKLNPNNMPPLDKVSAALSQFERVGNECGYVFNKYYERHPELKQ